MEAIKTIEKNGLTIKIYQDENPESPREWENLGIMACFHNRYTLGDKTDISSDSFSGWNEMEAYIKAELGAVVVLPLFLYDHSGISMRTFRHGHHSAWDCGQVGFIYATKEKIVAHFGKKIIATKKIEDILISEVETYSAYLEGNIYGFVIEDDAGSHIDSCCGFYNDDAEIEALEIVENLTHKGTTDHKGQLLLNI